MAHLNGNDDVERLEIAIQRRGNVVVPVDGSTRICLNCNRSILNEIDEIETNPACSRLNVVRQRHNRACVVCGHIQNVAPMSVHCRAKIFKDNDIFIPAGVRICQNHLNEDDQLPPQLARTLPFVNRLYVINGNDLQSFLRALCEISDGNQYSNINDISDDDMSQLAPVTKEQFFDLFSFCDPVPQTRGHHYVKRKDLLLFLCKLKHGLSDDFLKVIFNYSSRQATSMAVSIVRKSLSRRFVNQNIGLNAISREQFINEHVTPFANALYNENPDQPHVIAYVDATYGYTQKSSNFKALRKTYSVHKSRHLVKPVMLCGPDGYIIDIQGPYFADSRNNDARILINEFQLDQERLGHWFQRDDIIIIDRGYRDATQFLQNKGILYYMPPLLGPGRKQFTTFEANQSRIITLTRWVVEARNGHIKSMFKMFQNVLQMAHVHNSGDFIKICGAIINRYRPLISMPGKTVEVAQQLLARVNEVNLLQVRVEREQLMTRRAQRWVLLDQTHVNDFPMLSIDDLERMTIGTYQVRLSPSYIQDKLDREGIENFEIELERDENRLPMPGLIRVRLYSRFRNATKYMLWIQYNPLAVENNNQNNRIHSYYCTCASGARTIGTCAHVCSVLWFLGYARHQDRVHYPPTTLMQSIQDAAIQS